MEKDVVARAFELAREGYDGSEHRLKLRREGFAHAIIEAYLVGNGVRAALKKLARDAQLANRAA